MFAFIQKNAVLHGRNGRHTPTESVTVNLAAAGNAIRLQKNQHVSMHAPAGWTVTAFSGVVWITQDGDVRDIVLEAGQSFVLDRDGPALLSSLDQSEISLTRKSCVQAAACGKMKPDAIPAFSAMNPSFA